MSSLHACLLRGAWLCCCDAGMCLSLAVWGLFSSQRPCSPVGAVRILGDICESSSVLFERVSELGAEGRLARGVAGHLKDLALIFLRELVIK